MIDKFKFIRDGGEVRRYHTVRTIHQETVAEHSFGVAMYCYLLCNPSANLLMAALTHDLAEHKLADIPSPMKRELNISDVINDMEERLLREIGMDFPLTTAEKRVLKLADIMQGMSFCLREMQFGNSEIDVVFHRYADYGNDMNLVGDELELFSVIMNFYWEHVDGRE